MSRDGQMESDQRDRSPNTGQAALRPAVTRRWLLQGTRHLVEVGLELGVGLRKGAGTGGILVGLEKPLVDDRASAAGTVHPPPRRPGGRAATFGNSCPVEFDAVQRARRRSRTTAELTDSSDDSASISAIRTRRARSALKRQDLTCGRRESRWGCRRGRRRPTNRTVTGTSVAPQTHRRSSAGRCLDVLEQIGDTLGRRSRARK